MIHLLFATDFSELSLKALSSALKLNSLINGKVVLFHAYRLTGSPGTMTDDYIQDMETEMKASLHDFGKSLNEACGLTVHFEYLLFEGTIIHGIEKAMELGKADLVFLSGHESFWGVNAVHIMENVFCPVWIIPENQGKDIPQNILYPTDLENLEQEMDFMFALIDLLSAKMTILHIIRDIPGIEDNHAENMEEMLKSNYLNDNISIIVKIEKDISKEILETIHSTDSDLVVFFEDKHSWIERWFDKDIPEQVAKKNEVPVLRVVRDMPIIFS